MSDKKFKVTITGFESSEDADMFAEWVSERSAVAMRKDWKNAVKKYGWPSIPVAPRFSGPFMTRKGNWGVEVLDNDNH